MPPVTSDQSDPDGGKPPSAGWQALVCELHVEDLAASRAFWCDILGFRIAFDRPAERFLYLERLLADGRDAQVMLCQRNGRWETGPMIAPLGQGMMFQIEVDDLASIQRALADENWPIHTPLRDVWRRTGDRESGQRELFVQDPDGYLLMLNENLGERPLASGLLT
ncbi:MAG: VOC family protein [Rhodospirillaceae bacterium]|jgi:catechol 2,3-dioxygenase-like lactoylglutathione lyase family enzyme|nr:VOC family protein [Rhodospirillaceae bacterium]MBT4490302.1 VOC family protein [Rhodospirillaceae bacterium]MBT5895200.1 VOC family protein [Rhodospirillaceae bacterium]MBT6430299.1 VOC family protein [Rhodospirillaceae bacterium]MBT7758362.1 VOC family protein [Rhodospirillaceae bacterium]